MQIRRTPVLLTALAAMLAAATVHAGALPRDKDVTLERIGTYETGIFDDGGSEIVAFDPVTHRMFSINGSNGAIEVIDLSDPANPTFLFSIDVTPWGKAANHVDVHGDWLVAAVEADVKQDPGKAVFFETAGSCDFLRAVDAGALPDMVVFSNNGRYVLVANEGEPDDDYVVDPEGSVTIIDLADGLDLATATTAGFGAWDGMEDALRAEGVRIFGPGASTSQDLEPEYIAVSHDNQTAWVSLQENNALAIVDLKKKEVTRIVALGFKDHTIPGNGFDASNRDGLINIANWPTRGMYQPDAIASYRTGGRDYIVTANEGDARDYDGYSEEERVKDLALDPAVFPDAAILQQDDNLGRLNSTTANGDTDGDGDFDEIYSFGARSMSIWNASGEQVSDTGDMFEQVIAVELAADFNSTNDENGSFDARSDDKGPEPEGVAVAKIRGRQYAFVGMERVGGIFVLDITDPAMPRFIEYVNDRDFKGDAAAGTAGDLAPEGLRFVGADDSPTGEPLLLAAHEVSGSVAIYRIASDRGDGGFDGPETVVAAGAGKVSLGNSPNPFNPMTTINFTLPRAADVRLAVYNVRGQLVETLVDGPRAAGPHAVDWSGKDLSSGVYLYMLDVDGMRTIKRMTLVK